MVYKIKVFGFIILLLGPAESRTDFFFLPKRPEEETLYRTECAFLGRKFCFVSTTFKIAETKPPTRNVKTFFFFLHILGRVGNCSPWPCRRGNLTLTPAPPFPPQRRVTQGATAAWPSSRARVGSGDQGWVGGGLLRLPGAPGLRARTRQRRIWAQAANAWRSRFLAPHVGLGS